MAKINFKEFNMPTGISGKHRRTTDVREGFADLLYQNVNGIRAHALAMKIYKSEGEEEYDANETGLIRQVAERMCVGSFIDGLYGQMNNENKEQGT